jgi:hypothetical protein
MVNVPNGIDTILNIFAEYWYAVIGVGLIIVFLLIRSCVMIPK